jgi:hypothetical protein
LPALADRSLAAAVDGATAAALLHAVVSLRAQLLDALPRSGRTAGSRRSCVPMRRRSDAQ